MTSRFWRAGSNNSISPSCNVLADVRGGGSSTVWNSSGGLPASSADYALSNANLTATRSVNTGNVTVFGSAGHSGTGDWWFDITISGTFNFTVGVANASHANNTFVGGDANSVGYNAADGQIYQSITGIGAGAAYNSANTIRVRVKNNKLYFAKDGVYQNGGDPVAQTGGIDISGLGVVFPACSTDTSDAFTANFANW
jgi:hypothetical protein